MTILERRDLFMTYSFKREKKKKPASVYSQGTSASSNLDEHRP